VSTAKVPTREEMVRRVSELVPVLEKHTAWAEENRRLHQDSVDALTEAGVFRMRTPKRYGGYESDTRTLVDVATELARVDGSLAWTAAVYWIPTWMAGLFPDQAQDEVFTAPDVRVCGTLSPSAMAAPADGGVVVNGKWGFITGAWHSQWQEIIAVQVEPDKEPQPIIALVPITDVQIVDDWHTSGLRGTGSVTTIAQDLFVPAHRVLPLGAVLQGQSASAGNAQVPMYRSPLLPVAAASSVGTVLGLARAGLEAFMERLPDRKITYTVYESQREAPVTHLQVADATMKVDEAEFHAHRLAGLVDEKCAVAGAWNLLERAQTRGDLGAVCRLGKDAVDILNSASGGSSIFQDVPIQRIMRDIQAVNQHALMNSTTNSELYGRILCGLDPNTLYL